MKIKKVLIINTFLALIMPGLLIVQGQNLNQLTREEKEGGWQLLFDGQTTDGWRGFNIDSMPPNWSVKNQALIANGGKGDIITEQQFGDFELSLEWKISKGGNSGVFYHVKEGEQYDKVWRTGIEMQIMDNERNPMAKKPRQKAGSLFAMYAPEKDVTKPAGKWNSARLIVNNGHVEYWMNGEKINEYELWTKKWYADREQTLHNKTRKPLWGEFRRGHIALQDEGYPVSYRNIKIKEIPSQRNVRGKPEFLPVTYLDQKNFNQRDGHKVATLINKDYGTTNGFKSKVSIYASKDFVINDPHKAQKIYYLLEGMGWAMVGDKKFPVHPGACWIVPPGTKHGIKCAATSKEVKVFFVQGAP